MLTLHLHNHNNINQLSSPSYTVTPPLPIIHISIYSSSIPAYPQALPWAFCSHSQTASNPTSPSKSSEKSIWTLAFWGLPWRRAILCFLEWKIVLPYLSWFYKMLPLFWSPLHDLHVLSSSADTTLLLHTQCPFLQYIPHLWNLIRTFIHCCWEQKPVPPLGNTHRGNSRTYKETYSMT